MKIQLLDDSGRMLSASPTSSSSRSSSLESDSSFEFPTPPPFTISIATIVEFLRYLGIIGLNDDIRLFMTPSSSPSPSPAFYDRYRAVFEEYDHFRPQLPPPDLDQGSNGAVCRALCLLPERARYLPDNGKNPRLPSSPRRGTQGNDYASSSQARADDYSVHIREDKKVPREPDIQLKACDRKGPSVHRKKSKKTRKAKAKHLLPKSKKDARKGPSSSSSWETIEIWSVTSSSRCSATAEDGPYSPVSRTRDTIKIGPSPTRSSSWETIEIYSYASLSESSPRAESLPSKSNEFTEKNGVIDKFYTEGFEKEHPHVPSITPDEDYEKMSRAPSITSDDFDRAKTDAPSIIPGYTDEANSDAPNLTHHETEQANSHAPSINPYEMNDAGSHAPIISPDDDKTNFGAQSISPDEIYKTRSRTSSISRDETYEAKCHTPSIIPHEILETRSHAPSTSSNEIYEAMSRASSINLDEIYETSSRVPNISRDEIYETGSRAPSISHDEIYEASSHVPNISHDEIYETSSRAPNISRNEIYEASPHVPNSRDEIYEAKSHSSSISYNETYEAKSRVPSITPDVTDKAKSNAPSISSEKDGEAVSHTSIDPEEGNNEIRSHVPSISPDKEDDNVRSHLPWFELSEADEARPYTQSISSDEKGDEAMHHVSWFSPDEAAEHKPHQPYIRRDTNETRTNSSPNLRQKVAGKSSIPLLGNMPQINTAVNGGSKIGAKSPPSFKSADASLTGLPNKPKMHFHGPTTREEGIEMVFIEGRTLNKVDDITANKVIANEVRRDKEGTKTGPVHTWTATYDVQNKVHVTEEDTWQRSGIKKRGGDIKAPWICSKENHEDKSFWKENRALLPPEVKKWKTASVDKRPAWNSSCNLKNKPTANVPKDTVMGSKVSKSARLPVICGSNKGMAPSMNPGLPASNYSNKKNTSLGTPVLPDINSSKKRNTSSETTVHPTKINGIKNKNVPQGAAALPALKKANSGITTNTTVPGVPNTDIQNACIIGDSMNKSWTSGRNVLPAIKRGSSGMPSNINVPITREEDTKNTFVIGDGINKNIPIGTATPSAINSMTKANTISGPSVLPSIKKTTIGISAEATVPVTRDTDKQNSILDGDSVHRRTPLPPIGPQNTWIWNRQNRY